MLITYKDAARERYTTASAKRCYTTEGHLTSTMFMITSERVG